MKESLGVRNKRSAVKSGMRGNPVFPALPGSHPSILDFSLFLLSSAASWTSSLLQAVGGNHFVKIPLCIV